MYPTRRPFSVGWYCMVDIVVWFMYVYVSFCKALMMFGIFILFHIHLHPTRHQASGSFGSPCVVPRKTRGLVSDRVHRIGRSDLAAGTCPRRSVSTVASSSEWRCIQSSGPAPQVITRVIVGSVVKCSLKLRDQKRRKHHSFLQETVVFQQWNHD